MSIYTQPTQASGEFVRKCLGIAGATLMVSGLGKALRGDLGAGVMRTTGGALIAMGGINSDIIYERLLQLYKRLKTTGNPRESTIAGTVKAVTQDTLLGIREAFQGPGKALGNAVSYELKMHQGLSQLKEGNVLTGLGYIYDGIYNKIRECCRALVYQIC
jgi:hypothetical protein